MQKGWDLPPTILRFNKCGLCMIVDNWGDGRPVCCSDCVCLHGQFFWYTRQQCGTVWLSATLHGACKQFSHNHKCLFRDNTAEDVHCNCDFNQTVMFYYIVHTYTCLLCIWKISTLNISILEITFLAGKNLIFCYAMCHLYHFLTFSNIPVSKYLFDCFLLFPSFPCWVGHFID